MRKFWWFSGLITLAILSTGAKQGLISSFYDWEKLPVKKTSSGETRNILHGSTRSLDMFDISAVTLSPGKEKLNLKVGMMADELIIIKEGKVGIQINADRKVLGEGSVIVAGSGDEVIISNTEPGNAVFFLICFKPFPAKKETPISIKVPPLFLDWNNIEFKPSENGGRRNIMQQKTSSLKDLEIHVTTLKEGLPSHAAHIHPDEEIILVRKGFVEETIKGEPYRLGPGSIIFLTNDDLHGISNSGAGLCEYYAIRWLTNPEGSE